MSSRTPPIPPLELNQEQRKIYDKVQSMCTTVFGNKFAWQDDNHSLIGPMSALIYTPQIADLYIQLGGQAKQISGLPEQAREVAILATGVVFQSNYEVYAHTLLASAAGLSSAHIEAIKAGSKPRADERWDDQCDVAFDVAVALTRTAGSLHADLWKRAREVLGLEGFLALVQYVALYAYTSIILNAVDEPIP